MSKRSVAPGSTRRAAAPASKPSRLAGPVVGRAEALAERDRGAGVTPARAALHRFGTIAVWPPPSPHRALAAGRTLGGRSAIVGRPSPTLVAHELVHMAQQRLGLRRSSPRAARSSLEAEAWQLAPRIIAGHPVRVELSASPRLPLYGSDPDKTYTSTEGLETDDAYIANAHEFHQKWGYNPIDVASIEEITADLASDSSKLSRIRIVSHASASGLFMRFTQGGRLGVLEGELAARTQEATEQAGVTEDAQWVDDGATEDFRKWVLKNHSALAGTLGITDSGIADADVEDLFRWVLNKHRAEGVPGLSRSERDLIMPAVDFEILAARTVISIEAKYNDPDVMALKAAVLGRSFKWSAMGVLDPIQEAVDRATESREAFTSRDLGDKQAKMRKRFDSTSTIEIRGCALGKSDSYMEAVQRYFGTASEKPAVHAPKLYQYYGNIGLYRVPDSDRQIQAHWNSWRHRADLRANFAKWAPIYAPDREIPASPTWRDLAAYLRAGHALPIRNGSRLFVLEGMSEEQVIDWFTKNDQRLTDATEIDNQFTKRVDEEAVDSNIFEWLQDAYTDTPSLRIFPYDPRWSAQFVSLAGVAPPPAEKEAK